VVFLILQPLLTGESAPMGRADDELTDAQHRKRIALLGLRDVEYDFHAGKLDEEDYRSQKAKLSSEALEAMDRELEETRTRGARSEARAGWRRRSPPSGRPSGRGRCVGSAGS
jgi:hypothetical protein